MKHFIIDAADMGWTKAFQPQLGIAGNVPVNQDWWMDFEMRFYNAGTSDKKKKLVSIYNNNGVLLKNISIKTASQTETLDFQHLSRGIYVVKALCNEESSEQRILRN
jgi:hypothetical protein